MSAFELSPAKHKAESARRRQNVRQDRPDLNLRQRKPRVIVASTSAEFEAAGGIVERLPSNEPVSFTVRPVRFILRGRYAE